MNNNTRFFKEHFHFDGLYLVYGLGQYTKDRRIVARFKYSKRDKASFIKFLIANFTVEEYFDAMANDMSPGAILESKGWVSPTVKKMRALRNEAATVILSPGVKKTLTLFELPHTAAGCQQYRELILCNAN